MIGSVGRWFRLTLPPFWAIVAAVFLLSSCEALYFWLRGRIGAAEMAGEASLPLLEMRDHFAAIILAAYGVFRAAAFHPLFRPAYRDWLEQTPWTSRKPLPLGPIHLVWQDVLLVGIVLASLHGTSLGRVWALAAFLLAYLGTLGISFWATGPWWMGYAVFFGMGLAVRLADWPLVYLAVLMIVYAVAFVGLGMAFARFPWRDAELRESLNRHFRANSPARRKSFLGWPLGQLSGAQPKRLVRRRDGVLGPLLVAWWVYALASLIPEAEVRSGLPGFLLLYVSMFAVLIRLLAYIGPYRPPISFWGRILTGRWIIPGYDYVFLAPLCTLLVALLGWRAALLAGPDHWGIVVYPLATAAVLIVALNMSPSLGQWSLTGHHRIAPWGTDPQRVKL